MNFLSNLISGDIRSSIKELFVGKRSDNINKPIVDHLNNISDIEYKGDHDNITSQRNNDKLCSYTGSSDTCNVGKSIKLVKRSKKNLTTCHQCGHYRFAKRNSKRVINPNYPYEHSPKGGCPIEPMYYVKPGKKIRKFCNCVHCISAAEMFNHNPIQMKKKNQYNYNRTPEQEREWPNLRKLGWYCRKGRYFSPGMKYRECKGFSAEIVF